MVIVIDKKKYYFDNLNICSKEIIVLIEKTKGIS